jgi:hypothetical protein
MDFAVTPLAYEKFVIQIWFSFKPRPWMEPIFSVINDQLPVFFNDELIAKFSDEGSVKQQKRF